MKVASFLGLLSDGGAVAVAVLSLESRISSIVGLHHLQVPTPTQVQSAKEFLEKNLHTCAYARIIPRVKHTKTHIQTYSSGENRWEYVSTRPEKKKNPPPQKKKEKKKGWEKGKNPRPHRLTDLTVYPVGRPDTLSVENMMRQVLSVPHSSPTPLRPPGSPPHS